MSYNPTTDFLGLWRLSGGQVSKVEMPGLDYVVAALARAGLISLSVGATAPVVSQSTTAWLQTAVPSNSAEGVLQLWNAATAAYVAATPALLLDMLQASAGQNGSSWWTTTGGPPLNTVGNNGDFAIRLDNPNGIYGPKALGAWPALPVPGTTVGLTSLELDNTFGTAEGQMLYRGPALWQALAIGAANTVAVSSGSIPQWEALSTLLDTIFGVTIGSVLYRNPGGWSELPPGAAGLVLTSNGAGASPSYIAAPSTFPSGTTMLFQQTAAPTGWTKQTAINDYGLRVTSGTAGTTPGTAFSTVFAQTTVGNTTLSVAQIPTHTHQYISPALGVGTGTSPNYFDSSQVAGTTDGGTGGNGAHGHSIQLALSYVDVIIASKN
jgi:hypothetical protein